MEHDVKRGLSYVAAETRMDLRFALHCGPNIYKPSTHHLAFLKTDVVHCDTDCNRTISLSVACNDLITPIVCRCLYSAALRHELDMKFNANLLSN